MATVGRLSTPGTRLAFDHIDSSAVNPATMRETADTVRKMGVEWKSTLDNPVGWLAGHGWEGATIARVHALGLHYGRPLPEFVDLTASNATLLCTAAN